MISQGDWTTFFTRGISLTLFLLIVLSLCVPLIRYVLGRRGSDDEAAR